MKLINFHRVWAVVVRHMMTWPRSLERIADAFWWPSFSIFMWGLVTLYLEQQTGTYQTYISLFLGGAIMWVFIYRSQEEMGVMFLQEAWDRNLLSMFTSPLTIWEFTIAAFLLSLIKLILSVIWMVVLAIILFQFDLFGMGWILLPYAINLLITGGILGIIINSLIVQFGYRIQVFAWTLVQILQPFSGVFYPLEVMPGWMQSVANALPSSYIFEGMRIVLREGRVDTGGLIMATVLNGIYFVFSVWFFTWSYGKARKSGALMKFS